MGPCHKAGWVLAREPDLGHGVVKGDFVQDLRGRGLGFGFGWVRECIETPLAHPGFAGVAVVLHGVFVLRTRAAEQSWGVWGWTYTMQDAWMQVWVNGLVRVGLHLHVEIRKSSKQYASKQQASKQQATPAKPRQTQ